MLKSSQRELRCTRTCRAPITMPFLSSPSNTGAQHLGREGPRAGCWERRAGSSPPPSECLPFAHLLNVRKETVGTGQAPACHPGIQHTVAVLSSFCLPAAQPAGEGADCRPRSTRSSRAVIQTQRVQTLSTCVTAPLRQCPHPQGPVKAMSVKGHPTGLLGAETAVGGLTCPCALDGIRRPSLPSQSQKALDHLQLCNLGPGS